MLPISSTYRSTVAAIAFVLVMPAAFSETKVNKNSSNSEKSVTVELSKKYQNLSEKAESGDAEAQSSLAFFLLNDLRLGLLNSDIAGRWFLKAAKQGNDAAINWIIVSFGDSDRVKRIDGWFSRELTVELRAFADGYMVASAIYSKKPKN